MHFTCLSHLFYACANRPNSFHQLCNVRAIKVRSVKRSYSKSCCNSCWVKKYIKPVCLSDSVPDTRGTILSPRSAPISPCFVISNRTCTAAVSLRLTVSQHTPDTKCNGQLCNSMQASSMSQTQHIQCRSVWAGTCKLTAFEDSLMHLLMLQQHK